MEILMTKIHAVIERGGSHAGLLIGLYEDRDHAIDVASSHAQHRIQRFLEADRRILKRSPDENDYELTRFDTDEICQIGLLHRPSSEPDCVNWLVDTREVITAPRVEQPDLAGLFASAGGAS
jgi:hypothetical protein